MGSRTLNGEIDEGFDVNKVVGTSSVVVLVVVDGISVVVIGGLPEAFL